MKVVMHELDYDMDDDDLKYVEAFNESMKAAGRMLFNFDIDSRNSMCSSILGRATTNNRRRI